MKETTKIQTRNQHILKLKRILVALELGKTDQSILNYLDFIANNFAVTDVAIYHVIPKTTLFGNEIKTSPVLGDFKLNNEVYNALSLEIKDKFKGHENTDIVFDIKAGNPLEQLIKEDELLEPDIILVGKNPSASSHGITVKNIARQVQANTWIVPMGSAARIKHILVPIDFSPYSEKALKSAIEIKNKLNHPIKITAINVYDTPNFGAHVISRNTAQLKKMILANKEEAGSNFINSTIGADQNVKLILKEHLSPSIGHYIAEYAESNEVDLIIMGAKGHSKIELFFMGSVTEKLISLEHQIPILVVK